MTTSREGKCKRGQARRRTLLGYLAACHNDFYEQIMNQNPDSQVRMTPGCRGSRWARLPKIRPGKEAKARMEFECTSLHQDLSVYGFKLVPEEKRKNLIKRFKNVIFAFQNEGSLPQPGACMIIVFIIGLACYFLCFN